MAVYKLFPSQDTTLYSLYPTMNTGIDEIIEIKNVRGIDGTPDITRGIIKFDPTDISDIFNDRIGNSNFNVSLKAFISYAQGINLESTLEVYPLAQNWENGTGKYLDSPLTTNGASWNSPSYSGSGQVWIESGSSGGNYFTSSYNSSYSNQGGGSWYYSGSGVNNFLVTQSFTLRSEKDLDIDVTTIVDKWNSGSLPNNGFLIKWTGSIEYNINSSVQPIMKFYSIDTNTIYPPYLELKWDDYSTVLTGSLSSSIVDTTSLKISLNENPGVFYEESINRFRINVSPLYPARTYRTSSIFSDTNYLPTESYWAIKDLDTNEYVINFDTTYTKISSDTNGNYFDVYMNGLEPERYYEILLKTNINGSTIILKDDFYFKVIN